MSRTRILWVDDDKDLVRSLKPSLEKEGWDVQSVGSAEEAKAAAADNRPDLIVMDIIMQGEHGYSAIEQLRGDSQLVDVPVVVFSSLPHRWGETTATREDALLSSAAEFVDKSSEPGILVSTIQKHLKSLA